MKEERETLIKVLTILGTVCGILTGFFAIGFAILDIFNGGKPSVRLMLILVGAGWGYAIIGYRTIVREGWFKD